MNIRDDEQFVHLAPEYVYKLALRALADVDAADIAVRMNDAGEKFKDTDYIKFSDEFDLDDDIEPRNVTKAIYLIVKEVIKRYYKSSDGSGTEVFTNGIYVDIDEYGISIQYRPLDLYVTEDKL